MKRIISGPPNQVFVVDCLRGRWENDDLIHLLMSRLVGDTHASHFALKDSLAAARQVNATKTYLVGTTHRVDHYEMEASLATLEKEEGLRVAPAFDGLRVLFNDDKTLTETSYLDDQPTRIGATL